MFDNLTKRLFQTLKNVTGKSKLSDDNIKSTLREIRLALLDADVALPVVKSFITTIRERAIGQQIQKSLSPGQAFVKIVNEELVDIMGKANDKLTLATQPPAVVLMAGLQGAGKTTTVAKLAHHLQNREHKRVLVASADVYRPGAIEQLKTLAVETETSFYETPSSDPVEIARSALREAKLKHFDVFILDTAGRLHIDEQMMGEIQTLHNELSPIETLFVVDSMTGQDAANAAKSFHEALPLTGVILTKADGDARGGAALSVRYITGKPIKFLGVGEKPEALEAFHPDRIASRILGMGDMLSLIEEAEQKLDKQKADKLAKKLKKGKGFNLDDFREQLQQMKRVGGLSGVLEKLPNMGGVLPSNIPVNDNVFSKMETIINSMTAQERAYPDLINGSRKKRISSGSGTHIQEINRLLKQFKNMQKMMKKIKSKGGAAKMMRTLNGMQGLKGMGSGGFPSGGGFPDL